MEFTQEIFDRINSFDTIKAGFKAIAAETGYSENTIYKKYYEFKKINAINYSFKKEKTMAKYKDIILEVSKHPDNISEALRIIAKKYNTTIESVQYMYYHRIKNDPNCPVFTLVSKKAGAINVKNNINNKYLRYKTNHSFIEQTWGKIKYFINNILK